MRKSNAGFTLVELVAALAAAALVMAAAASLLLLGMRVENRSRDTARQQQTVHIVLSITEELAAGGDIGAIERAGDSWALYNKDGAALLEYLSGDGSLIMGDSVLMQGLKNAEVSVEGKLFTIEIETEKESYKTSVYCRVGDIEENIS